MAYTGDVVPGGPSDVRELDELVIRKASVGPMDNDTYLLTCRGSGDQLLVDAAADPERLLALVREGSGSARLATVVTTHRHPDHHGALESLVAVTGAATAAGAADADALPVHVARRLVHGDVVLVGHVTLEVVALRGHTPGSVALAYREPTATRAPEGVAQRVHLFTGDSLFPGGPGRTRDPEAFASLMTDLEERVFGRFDDLTWVYPGHGRDTTLGAERPHLAAWRARGW
ncbi:MBL fold metallo-hydrolase [Actinotalea solisilvae]|uniref:MBL fold metallo-hydrolase n=1 Tax=Actinotalea solisilvae TaxID=2072922 RepID=UPI0027DC3A55|nr:MBL fold metallo-hydrolase [Actinotalea solisilvae]